MVGPYVVGAKLFNKIKYSREQGEDNEYKKIDLSWYFAYDWM